MIETKGQLIARKLKSTFLTLLISSIVWSLVTIYTDEEIVYHLAEHFYVMTLFYFYYAGFIVLIYGNLVSVLTESILRKWAGRFTWLYIPILGFAGAAIGLLLPYYPFIIAGILTGICYGVLDKWIMYRWERDSGVLIIFIALLVLFFLLWGYFYVTSPILPTVKS